MSDAGDDEDALGMLLPAGERQRSPSQDRGRQMKPPSERLEIKPSSARPPSSSKSRSPTSHSRPGLDAGLPALSQWRVVWQACSKPIAGVGCAAVRGGYCIIVYPLPAAARNPCRQPRPPGRTEVSESAHSDVSRPDTAASSASGGNMRPKTSVTVMSKVVVAASPARSSVLIVAISQWKYPPGAPGTRRVFQRKATGTRTPQSINQPFHESSTSPWQQTSPSLSRGWRPPLRRR